MAKAKLIKLSHVMGAFQKKWNERIDTEYERPGQSRDYIWASEIGNSFYDRFLRMTNVPPTTPPNFRSQNKFKTGEITEWVLARPFIRCGIMREQQLKVRHQLPGLLMVSGEIDFMIGNKVDMKAGLKSYEEMDLPDFFEDAEQDFIEVSKDWTDIEEGWCEIKSCSSQIFKRLEARHKPNAHHEMQGFHYAYTLKKPGIITYFCKDDSRMLHFYIDPNDKELFARYEKDITMMTDYYYRNETPIKPPIIIFEDGKFGTNWHVEYSNYITHFGFESPKAYRDEWDPKIARWNRVLDKLAKNSKDITADNRLAIQEMTPYFPKTVKIA